MNKLNYKTLEEQGYQGYLLKEAPERILQFGEGNFMRAFVDYFWCSQQDGTPGQIASPTKSMNKRGFIHCTYEALKKARR